MIRRLGFIALALVAALALGGCFGGGAKMDSEAIESGLVEIDGVVDASVGFRNDGWPGSTALDVELVVDQAGLADLPNVLDAAIDVVAADASGYSSYGFSVAAVDSSSPTGTIGLNLDEEITSADVPAGRLGSSLRLTPDELRQAAGS